MSGLNAVTLLTQFFERYRGLVILSVLFGLITSILSLAAFHLVGEVAREGPRAELGILFGVTLVIFMLSSYSGSLIAARFTSSSIKDIRVMLVNAVLNTPLLTLENIGHHRLHNVLTHDVNTIAAALKELPTFIYNAVLLSVCLVYLFFLSPIIFLGIIVLLLLAVLVDSAVIHAISRWGREKRKRQDTVMKHFYALVYGLKQLILDPVRKKDFVTTQIHRSINEMQRVDQRHSFFWDLNRNINQLMIFVILGAVVLTAHLVGQPENIVNYLIAVTFLSGPFRYIIGYWPDIVSARISVKKIDDLALITAPLGALSDKAQETDTPWHKIRFRQVSFSYPSGNQLPPCIAPFDLDIHRGETLFVRGKNGSGKSTLVHLITGLYLPTSGEMWVDDELLNANNIGSYRCKMATVLHEFNLFSKLLDRNGNMPPEDQIQELLSLFDIRQKVVVKAFHIEEKAYSKGQTKRLALLSAMLENKQIYVLDEWAAEQDPAFRKTFYEHIIPCLKARGKTVIAVTHDDQYYRFADRIVSVEDGVVSVDYPMPGVPHNMEVIPSDSMELPRV